MGGWSAPGSWRLPMGLIVYRGDRMADGFDEIVEGLQTPAPAVEESALAGRCVGAFFLSLTSFGVPTNYANYLTTCWMELGCQPEEPGQ